MSEKMTHSSDRSVNPKNSLGWWRRKGDYLCSLSTKKDPSMKTPLQAQLSSINIPYLPCLVHHNCRMNSLPSTLQPKHTISNTSTCPTESTYCTTTPTMVPTQTKQDPTPTPNNQDKKPPTRSNLDDLKGNTPTPTTHTHTQMRMLRCMCDHTRKNMIQN